MGGGLKTSHAGAALPLEWRWHEGGLVVGNAILSFQRFRRPSSGQIATVPQSHGSLPTAAVDGGFLVALPDDEAFWMGVDFPGVWPHGSVDIVIEDDEGSRGYVRKVPPSFGILLGSGAIPHRVLDRRNAVRLRLECAGARTIVGVVGPRSFTATTGRAGPKPFDPGAAYGGWWLP